MKKSLLSFIAFIICTIAIFAFNSRKSTHAQITQPATTGMVAQLAYGTGAPGTILTCNSASSKIAYYESSTNQIFVCDGAGWNLVVGQIGPTGATGAVGPTGSTGSTGNQGVPGNTGSTGSQGIPGAAGAAGSTGAVGATGPAGANGIIPIYLNNTLQSNVRCDFLTTTTAGTGLATFSYSAMGFTTLIGQPQPSIYGATSSPYLINIQGTPTTSSTTVYASVASIISVVGINVSLIGVAASAPVGLTVCGV